jgi:hypothetical protein
MTSLDVKPQPTAVPTRSATPWIVATAVVSVIAVALAIILMAATGVFAGQSDAEGVAADYHDAWASLDSEAVAGFFPEYGSIEFVPEGVTYEGPAEIAAYAEEYSADAVLSTGDSVSKGSFVATPYEWDWTGTGTITFTGISVVEIVGDQVVTHYIFND